MTQPDDAQPAAPYYPPPVVPPAPRSENPRPGFRNGLGVGTGIGLGLMAGVIVLSTISGLFMLIAVGLLTRDITSAGASTSLSTVWGSPTATGRLRAISISGTILTDAGDGNLLSAGTYGYEIAAQLDELTKEDAAGVVLLVNTPGGSITGSRAISDAVTRYKERTGQPVLVHVEGISASGGVHSTATATEIIADHGAMIGSIGVIMGPLVEYRDVVATGSTVFTPGVTTTGGITQRYLTAGTGKDFGNPYRAATEEENARMQAIIDGNYQAFVSHVATNRGIPEETIRNELGAHIFSAEEAVANGLADKVMGREEFFQHAATTAGLDPSNTVVESVGKPTALQTLLGAKRAWGVSQPLAELGQGAVVSPTLCSATRPMVFAGDVRAVCG
ncbi:MAG: S49 family peptidase [Propionibacteriaceae bacterium]|nr:S49 family peptidase [Propionibacteriaceae bacterium]